MSFRLFFLILSLSHFFHVLHHKLVPFLIVENLWLQCLKDSDAVVVVFSTFLTIIQASIKYFTKLSATVSLGLNIDSKSNFTSSVDKIDGLVDQIDDIIFILVSLAKQLDSFVQFILRH